MATTVCGYVSVIFASDVFPAEQRATWREASAMGDRSLIASGRTLSKLVKRGHNINCVRRMAHAQDDRSRPARIGGTHFVTVHQGLPFGNAVLWSVSETEKFNDQKIDEKNRKAVRKRVRAL